MALLQDTAITNDKDFEKILAIQNIGRLNRDKGNWDSLHVEAVNSLRTEFGNKLNPDKITNEEVWREYLITWIAQRIFMQHALDGGDEVSMARAEMLDERLPRLFSKAYEATIVDTDNNSTGDRKLGRAIPQVLNLDSGGRFSTSGGRGVKYNRGMKGYGRGVKDAGKHDNEHL